MELAQFIGTSVLPGTRRTYDSHWDLWKHFIEVHGGGVNMFLKGIPEAEKAALVGSFHVPPLPGRSEGQSSYECYRGY